MANKGKTLNQFIYTEMTKNHIEKNSKNLTKLRNKINYLITHDPRLSQLKDMRDKTPKNNQNEKYLPQSYWNKISKNISFQTTIKKMISPDYLAALAQLDDYYNGNPEDISVELERIEKGLPPAKNLVTKEVITSIMIQAIFEHLFPKTKIDTNLLNHDLNLTTLYPDTVPESMNNELIHAYKRQQNPVKYYLKKSK